MDWFDALSPLDYRYYGRDKYVFEKISPYLSENARISYQAKVEAAYLKGLAKHGVASAKAAQEIQKAASNVSAEAVYQEEDRVRHDIRALVNVMKQDMGHSAKPFVHLGATSNDIINTADALRFQDFTKNALLPELLLLEKTIINIARTEKSTLQIGRTHGQHAEPLTFGFALAEYVSRLGGRIQALESAGNNLRGKISGAVGAYNATSLLVHDPEALEKDVLHSLGLKPASHSKQVVEPEHALDLLHAITSAFGVLANLADDLRHLQRTEIAEVGEAFGTDQVGSSTMPHKRNP
ncbi:MAG: adenylosuccinate lyase, partial [Candidatus Aenigmarchaeota archaeon]|nr:adenylosuccinate lyase [Candidatus Aenigmarchaeota archaeon]